MVRAFEPAAALPPMPSMVVTAHPCNEPTGFRHEFTATALPFRDGLDTTTAHAPQPPSAHATFCHGTRTEG